MKPPLGKLKPFNKEGDLNVIVETPRGSRGKYAYNPELHLFELRKFMPAGMGFPYDFGFIPGTLGDDGDPLDAIILIDIEIPLGCLLACKALGVLEAEQIEGKKCIRNDRIIAIPTEKKGNTLSNLHSTNDLNPQLIKELDAFFTNYNEAEGVRFKMLGCKGSNRALNLIKTGSKRAR